MHLPVTLRPRPSLALAGALILAHVLAFMGLLPAALPLSVKLLIGLALLLSLAWYWRRHFLCPPVRVLTLKADGSLDIERCDGVRGAARVHPQTTVLPWLVVLLLQVDGRLLALILPPDALGADDHRLLRLWLRWKPNPG